MRQLRQFWVVALAVLLVSCSSGASQQTSDGSEEAGEGTAADQAREDAVPPSTDAAPDGTPQQGGTLIAASAMGFESLDPGRNVSGVQLEALSPIYDSLIHIDRSNPAVELEPGLATEWQYLNDTTFQLTLRDNVTFHDGVEMDASAVVANLERYRDMEDSSSLVQEATGNFESIEAMDDLTVQISLTQPVTDLPYQLADVIGMMVSPEAFGGDLDRTAVGAGMFRLVEFRPGDRLEYEAFDDYWNPEILHLDKLILREIPDAATTLRALESGQVHIGRVEPRSTEAAESAGLRVLHQDAHGSVMKIALNRDRGALDSLEVRQAIMHAIDRQALSDSLGFGTTAPTVQVFPKGNPAYNDEYPADYYEFDPDRARELIEQSGIEDVSLTMMVYTRPFDQQLGTAIQQMLTDVGIDLSLYVVNTARFIEFIEGEVDMMQMRLSLRTDPLAGFRHPSLSLITPLGEEGDGPLSAEIDQVAKAEPGSPERSELLQEVSATIVEKALTIPLFSRYEPSATAPCVRGYEPAVYGAEMYRGIWLEGDCEVAG